MMTHETGNMGPSGDKLPNPLTWRFMDEPLWRWFIFFLAMSLMLNAWRGVIAYMK